MSMKNPLTPAGMEPATFRFVVQHLNHCATAVPPRKLKFHKNPTRIMVALHDYLCRFMIFSHGIVLRTRNFSERSCREI